MKKGNNAISISLSQKAEVATEKYAELYYFAPLGYYTLSNDGKIIDLNLIGSQILGRERTSLINSQLCLYVSDDSRQVFKLFFEKMFQTKSKETCEVTISTNGNSPIYVLLVGIIIKNGEQCLVTAFDITERRLITEAQEFLLKCGYHGSGEDFFESLSRYLAKSLEMEYVCIDRLEGDGLTAQTVAIYNDGKFDTNVAYALKETPCGDVVGKTVCCFPKDVCELFPHDASLQDLKAVSYIGTTLWSFDGKAIGLIAVIGRKPLKNPDLAATVLKMVSVRAAGELERNLAESALKKSEVQLLELNATKDKFFNIVAHDLKNPFTSLLGSSELLSANIDKMNNESIRKLAMILNDSAKGGYAILQNLLDWSRSQTGLLEFNPERVKLNDLIAENIRICNCLQLIKRSI